MCYYNIITEVLYLHNSHYFEIHIADLRFGIGGTDLPFTSYPLGHSLLTTSVSSCLRKQMAISEEFKPSFLRGFDMLDEGLMRMDCAVHASFLTKIFLENLM